MTVLTAALCAQMTAAGWSLLAIGVLITSGMLFQVCVTFFVFYLALNASDDPCSPGGKAAS